MIKIGSLFAGIGGFELGLERAIPNSETIWQVEQDKFCQRVLRKHWPQSKIYNDVREVSSHNLEPVDLLYGGFPCQDISIAGKGEGLHGKKSGLWWEMHRIIRDIRPRVIVLENVSAVTFRGGLSVIGSLTELGYSCEWGIISARQFGAPHLRKRWFCVAYSEDISGLQKDQETLSEREGWATWCDISRSHRGDDAPHSDSDGRHKQPREDRESDLISKTEQAPLHSKDSKREKDPRQAHIWDKGCDPLQYDAPHSDSRGCRSYSDSSDNPKIQRREISKRICREDAPDSDGRHIKKQFLAQPIKERQQSSQNNIGSVSISGFGYWERCPAPSPICRVDDGIPHRVAKLRALGNAIVPQCSEHIGRLIHESGVLYG